jgi:signal transduction histidine kinase
MNKAMQKNFGHDLTGQICYTAFRNESKPCVHCTNSKLLDADGKIGQVYTWECTNPTTGISYINYDRAIQWVDGRIVRIQIATDVSERKKAENTLKRINDELEVIVQLRTAQLEKTNTELRVEIQAKQRREKALKRAKTTSEQANKAKSEFLANMSHELRTPLNHIIGFSELLADEKCGALNSTQHEYLQDVLSSSRHLLSLINDILDLAKVEAGKLVFEPSDLEPRRLLESGLSIVREKAMKHRIHLETQFNGLPYMIRGDERKLKQILYNLLSNAVKFTPAGGCITVGADAVKFTGSGWSAKDSQEVPIEGYGDWKPTAGSDYLHISVKDTGIGIAAKDLERIFDPFEQAENSASRKYQGTGLGLTLTRRFAEMHQGTVWATSPGRNSGSVFHLLVNIYQPVECLIPS